MKIPDGIKIADLVLKPDYASKISHWAFHPGLKFSISAGVLGAVGIGLLIRGRGYIDFSSSQHDVVYPRPWLVPGLQNLGNNCFLNVVLQGLSSCSSFRKHLREMVGEFGSVTGDEEGDDGMPLVKALNGLVEELNTIQHIRTVLSPRKLMVLMEHYIPDFNLTSQQDAEEAFTHLLRSLREEISQHFVINKTTLADVPTLQRWVFDEESVWQRWNRCYLKPFNGIIGSILTCQSCSFQISLDFQLFHSLHLSPPISGGSTVMAGCTLNHCLKQFFIAERVENYCCSHCWHAAATDYSSVFDKDKADIEILQKCNKNDSCECKNLPSLKAFPWSNRFSRTFKQLSISRSPKILCIHLQRASYNMFGQSVKLQGHISFPSILDMSPFMSTGVGLKNIGSDSNLGPLLNRSSREIRSFSFPKYQNMTLDPGKLSSKSTTEAKVSSGEQEKDTITVESTCSKASGSILLDEKLADVSVLSQQTSIQNYKNTPLSRQMYRLVSVVVHYGTSGGGHYTVYRKVTAKLGGEDPVALLESSIEQWFCVSDSDVCSVSEKEVLGANASMLFYEKIDNP